MRQALLCTPRYPRSPCTDPDTVEAGRSCAESTSTHHVARRSVTYIQQMCSKQIRCIWAHMAGYTHGTHRIAALLSSRSRRDLGAFGTTLLRRSTTQAQLRQPFRYIRTALSTDVTHRSAHTERPCSRTHTQGPPLHGPPPLRVSFFHLTPGRAVCVGRSPARSH